MVNEAYQLLLDPVGSSSKYDKKSDCKKEKTSPTFTYSSDNKWVAAETGNYKKYNLWTSTNGKVNNGTELKEDVNILAKKTWIFST